MTSWLGGILKDPEKRAIASWLGAGGLAVAGVIGSIVTFYVDHKEPHEKSVTNIYILDANAAKTLTAQLISDRLTPATAGSQEAVGGAVQSIARGAAAGDSRLQ
jgi:hypothetical protein